MITQGHTYHVVVDHEDVRRSPNTDMAAAWHSLGGAFGTPQLEKVMEAGKPYATWVYDGTEPLAFPSGAMTFEEFKKAWNSLEWCQANEWHPVAIMRAFRDNSRDMKRQAHEMATGVRLRKGLTTAVVYDHSPEWLKQDAAKLV